MEAKAQQAAAEAAETYTVQLEPVGVEMEVHEGETVLDAAFRQGVALMHGCKEGQCASCKAILHDGDVEMKKYSTFALSDMERDQNHVLLCRTLAYSDLEVELLNYDEEVLTHSVPVKDYEATVTGVTELTHDIRLLDVDLGEEMKFYSGQYCDLTIPGTGITRSFSMANAPSEQRHLQFIIKKYPDGAFSSQLDGKLSEGTRIEVKGPFGTCFRREEREGPLVLVGGGSGMSPLLSILEDQLQENPEREIHFFYGARTTKDLFYLDRFAGVAGKHPNFRFVPALSHAGPEEEWNGETGFIHEVVERHLSELDIDDEADSYTCGPPPLIDAVVPVLQVGGFETERIYFDKFTPAAQ
jgi:propane monooxygenase reductase subunit